MRVSLVWMLAVVVSCGGDDKNDTPVNDAGLTVDVSQTSLTIAEAAQGSVTLTLSRTGSAAGEVVALAVTGLPDGVTASFDNAATTADTAILTIVASATAAQTPATLTVTATTGILNASAAIALTVTAAAPFDVHGKLMDSDGHIGPGFSVTLWSGDGSAAKQATTQSDGTFAIAGVHAPYDIAFQTTGFNALVLGSTSATPVYAISIPYLSDTTTKVTPSVSGTSGTSAGVITACPSTSCGSNDGGGYSYQCRYPASVTAPETCHASALQYSLNATAPYAVNAYTGYGATDVTITPHANNAYTVPLTGPLLTRSWKFFISTYVPAGGYGRFYAPGYTNAYWDISLQNSETFTDGAYTITIPNDARVHFAVRFSALSANNYASRVVDLSADSPVITLPSPAIVVTPQDSAHVASGTMFAYTPRDGAVFTTTLAYGPPVFVLVTSQPVLPVIDVFAEHGFTIPPGPQQLTVASTEPATVDTAFGFNVEPGLVLSPASVVLTVD